MFDLALRTRASLHTDGDPDQWVTEYDGVVIAETEDGKVRTVGRVKARRVHAAAAAAHGESLFDVCDCHSHELHVLHTLLYRPRGYQFKRAVVGRFAAILPDLLVIDYVVLHPRWRGLKVGLLAARRLVDVVGSGCGLAVANIAPLRRDAHKELRVPARWLPDHRSDEDWGAAAVPLRRHFRRMGFTRLGRTPFYALPLVLGIPTADELLRPGGPPSDPKE